MIRQQLTISKNFLLLIYSLLTILVLSLFKLHEAIKALIVLPLYLTIPYLFGFGITKIVRMLKVKKFSNSVLNVYDPVSAIFYFWVLGSIFICFSALLLALFGFFYINLIFLLILIVSIFGVIVDESRFELVKFLQTITKRIDVFIAILNGLIPALIVNSYAPFPLIHTQMLYVLNDAIYRILDGFLWFPFSYSPLYFLIHAIFSQVCFISPWSLLWSHKFFLYPIFTLGIFLFSNEVTKQRLTATFASFIGSWILLGVNIMIPIRSVPQYILLAVFPYVLYFVTKNYYHNREDFNIKKNLLTIIFPSISCVVFALIVILLIDFELRNILIPIFFFSLFFINIFIQKIYNLKNYPLFIVLFILLLYHTYEGLISIIVVVFFMLSNIFVRLGSKSRLIMYSISISLLLIIILQKFDIVNLDALFNPPLSFYLFGEKYEAIYKTFDFNTKYTFLLGDTPPIPRNTPFIIYTCLVATLFYAFFAKEYNLKSIAFTSIFIFAIYFFPEPFTYRMDYLAKPFLSVLVAGLFVTLAFSITRLNRLKLEIKIFKKLYSLKINFNRLRNDYLSTSFVIVIAILLIPNLTNPLCSFLSNYDVSLNTSEYDAAMWIKKYLKENTIVVSDLQSVVIFQGLSHTIPFLGRGMLTSELSKEQLTQYLFIKNDIFMAKDSCEAWNNLHKLKDELKTLKSIDPLTKYYLTKTGKMQKVNKNLSIIVIISGRTSQWVKSNEIGFEKFPVKNIDEKILEKFFDEKYFSMIYQNKEVYIFKVKKNG